MQKIVWKKINASVTRRMKELCKAQKPADGRAFGTSSEKAGDELYL